MTAFVPQKRGHRKNIALRLAERALICASGCYEWMGRTDGDGYGRMHVSRTLADGSYLPQWKPVHRVAYEYWVGPIPEGLTIDHLCRNKRCFRPDHLEAVPSGVNTLRGEGAAARNARKTHCKHGHPFDEANTRYLPSGYRECKMCHWLKRHPAQR
jgi:HNH endonuclease